MNIKRIINQNNKLILYVFFIIVFVLLVINLLNSYYEEKERKKFQNIALGENVNNTTVDNDNIILNSKLDTIEEVMEKFIMYCNNKEIQDAYDMITDECKQVMFDTKEKFSNNYLKNYFSENRIYSMEKWSVNGDMITYRVKLYGDILATGENSNALQDYYTFVKVDNTYKINVNNFICGKLINKKFEKNGIEVKIINKKIYNNYEEYELEFTNNTTNEISLTGNKYVKNIYLKNSMGTTYSSINSSFDNNEITIKPNNTKKYKVKFNKIYNPQNQVNTIVLSDVIMDYEEYINYDNKNNYTNRISIEIKL